MDGRYVTFFRVKGELHCIDAICYHAGNDGGSTFCALGFACVIYLRVLLENTILNVQKYILEHVNRTMQFWAHVYEFVQLFC